MMKESVDTPERKNHPVMLGRVKSGDELALCPSFGRCGACSLLDVPYREQLERKQREVKATFAGLVSPDAIRPILGMDDPYHYRNKVISPFVAAPKRKDQAKGRGKGRGPILTGMYVKGTHRLVSTDGCLVENADANAVVAAVRDLMIRRHIEPYDEDTGAGFLRHVLVRVGHNSGEVLVTLVTNGKIFPSSRAFCRELVKRCPFVTTVVQNVNTRSTNVILGGEESTLYGPGFILDTLCGLSFRISSRSFYQVNAEQTEVLYRTAVDLAHLTGDELVIDTYCGTGTIGLMAARRLQELQSQRDETDHSDANAPTVIGVDSQASSIRDAKQNARHNGIENARFTVADAGEFLRKLAGAAVAGRGDEADNDDANGGRGDGFGKDDANGGWGDGFGSGDVNDGGLRRATGQRTVLFMDPPRAGASEDFLDAVGVFKPDRIVYISCAMKTQARDVRKLQTFGYSVETLQPVDMFPHTPHVETVALLTR